MPKLPPYTGQGFKLNLTLSQTQLVANATMPFPIPGFSKKMKAVFKIDKADQKFTSWKLYDAKGNLALSYSNFGDQKPVNDVLNALNNVFGDQNNDFLQVSTTACGYPFTTGTSP